MPTASAAATLADSSSPDVAVDTADGATATTTSAVATLAASSSPDVVVGIAHGATATTASAADTGMDVDTDPSPAVIAPSTAEHISSFLLHIRRRAADDAAPSSLDVAGSTVGGATATAASAADDGLGGISGASPTEAGVAAHEAISAAAQPTDS